MIAIDSNVLVRFLTADNPSQYKASQKLFDSAEIFIPDTVILEAEWVLRAAYDLDVETVCNALRQVFGLKNVHLLNGQLIAQTITWHESGLDFADAFHLALSQDHDALKTFDADFIKRAKSLSECRAEKP